MTADEMRDMIRGMGEHAARTFDRKFVDACTYGVDPGGPELTATAIRAQMEAVEEQMRYARESHDSLRRIDPAAAEWLEFGDHSTVINFNAGKGNLDDAMIWSSTPQGHNYWERLHDAVDYEEEEEVPKEDFKKGERVEVRDYEDEDWEEATFRRGR